MKKFQNELLDEFTKNKRRLPKKVVSEDGKIKGVSSLFFFLERTRRQFLTLGVQNTSNFNKIF